MFAIEKKKLLHHCDQVAHSQQIRQMMQENQSQKLKAQTHAIFKSFANGIKVS